MRRLMTPVSYILAIALLLLSGCAVKSKVQTPTAHVPTHWSEPATHGIDVGSPALREWWKTFQDSALDSLVERAIPANLDLRIAAARVIEARAARGVSKSALLPSVGTSGGYTRFRGGIAQGRAPFETSIFQIGFDASWELDFFGGLRHDVEAATADLRAAEEGRKDLQVTVRPRSGGTISKCAVFRNACR